MQVQYVVDFDVRLRGASTSAAVYDALLRHAQEWLEFAHDGVPVLGDLPPDGATALQRRELGTELESLSGEGTRQLSWHRVETASAFAHRVDLRVPVGGVPATHVTGVTLAVDAGREFATLRVVTGREAHGGWISPTPTSFLRGPAVVRWIVEDPALVVRAHGRRVDGLRNDVTSPAEADVLTGALRRVDRLPVLLLAPAEASHLDVADAAARELPGLTDVVCLRSPGARAGLAALGPGLSVQPGQARLVWPHLAALTHPLLLPGPDLAGEVLRTVAPLSVVSRGVDVPFRKAERAGRALAALDRRRQVEVAAASGDTAAELDAVRRQLDAARSEIDAWVEETHRLETEVDSLAVALGQVGTTRRAAPVAVDRRDAPPLDSDDAGPLLDFLEATSAGRLRFTADVERTWRKSGYLHPALMRSALLTLGEAAVEFSRSQGRISGRLRDWFREGFGLDVATTNLALKQSGRATFAFEGRRLDGVPHVKLGDAKRPNECGRIYFAHQSDPARFVVHHVGVHDL